MTTPDPLPSTRFSADQPAPNDDQLDTNPIPVASLDDQYDEAPGHYAENAAPELTLPEFDGRPSSMSAPWWDPPSPAVTPVTPPRSRSPRRAVTSAAAIAVVAAVAAAAWLLWAPTDHPDAPAAPAPFPTTSTASNPLLDDVSALYPPGACTAVSVANATAAVTCTSTDSGAPASATYMRVESTDAIESAFDSIVHTMTVAVCPRRIQSPGRGGTVQHRS